MSDPFRSTVGARECAPALLVKHRPTARSTRGMRVDTWRALLAELQHAARAGSDRYAAWSRDDARFARASDPIELVAWLCRPSDVEARSVVLGALIERLHGDGADGALARTLLWLAMWPSLDATFARFARQYAERQNELVSEIGYRFTELISRYDPKRAPCVVAGLALGTRRDIAQSLRREVRRARTLVAVVHAMDVEDPPTDAAIDALLAWLPAADDAERWLVEQLGNDGVLVHSVVVQEERCNAAAAALGLRPDAANKRVRRALARLRARCVDFRVSDFEGSMPLTL
jgi:hypothetical protein